MELKDLNEVQLTLIACCAKDSNNAISAAEVIVANSESMKDALVAIFWNGMCTAISKMAFRKIISLVRDEGDLNAISKAALLAPNKDSSETMKSLLELDDGEMVFPSIMHRLTGAERGKLILEKYFQHDRSIEAYRIAHSASTVSMI